MKHFNTYYLIIHLLFSISIMAQYKINRPQVIAAYINNFAHYITWPNENQLDSFNIILFTDNINIINEFNEFSRKRKIKDKPIFVLVYKSNIDLENACMIILTQDKSDYLPEIYNAIEGKPVLLISENYNDKRNIMINLYETKQEQILFEINKANIINQNLTINPEILLAGGTEIDVASLYRKSQISLRSMKKEINKMKDSLEYLNQNIKTFNNQINKQQSELLELKLKLNENNDKLISFNKEIDFQKSILKSQKDSIRKKNSVLSEQLEEAVYMQKFLNEKQNEIEKLNKEIEYKNKILGNQSEIIARQKLILLLFIIVIILSVVWVLTIFINYRSNKKKKDILAKQKKEIENQLKEMKQLNLKLEQADQYKSIFLASMSHELRTPLNSIIGYTGILLMGMTGELNDEQNKQLNKVKNNAKHLLSLINDILDISKIEANHVELHYEKINLKKLLNEVIETIHPKIIEKKLELTSDAPDNLIISTDIRRLKQVVLNLVSNAVNYTDTGNIHLYANQIEENKLVISVKDTGIGIPENELIRLFQPFQQIDSSLTKNNKGTGLGLYLCKKLMNMLNGKIYVKSKLGKGSEFYIEIPVNN